MVGQLYSPLLYKMSWKSFRLFSSCLVCIDMLTDRLTNRPSAGMQTHMRTKQILIYFVYIFYFSVFRMYIG
jgi:hypothetical protein